MKNQAFKGWFRCSLLPVVLLSGWRCQVNVGIPKQGCLLSHSFMCCRYYAILPSARPGSAPRIGSTRRSASVRKGDALYAVLPLIGILSCRVDVMGCDRTRIYRGNGLELRYLCRCNARASRSSVLYSTAEHSTRQASDTRGFMGDWDPTGQLYEICIEQLHQPSSATHAPPDHGHGPERALLEGRQQTARRKKP